jgi:uncharacterized repeat protein (TIGR03803 family)
MMVWRIPARRAARAILVLLLGTLALPAQARDVGTMHRFRGSDGAEPMGALIEGPDGMLYGTTRRGGPAGRGTVFRITPDGTATLLYDFRDPAVGGYPFAGLYRDAQGNLFGTSSGDDHSGSVFEIPVDGSGAKGLHTFSRDDKAGYAPVSQLVGDASGNLYGTTLYGGPTAGAGTAFKLRPDGTIRILHHFGQSQGDGGTPAGSVIMDAHGNLYGTTYSGGAYNVGTVYRIARDGSYAILHDFNPVDDGIEPWGGLARDRQGNLYGTTIAGGNYGKGTVFRLAPDGTHTTLHSFTGQDGADAVSSPVLDSHGNLIVAASDGGIVGCGTVIEVRKDGTSRELHHFTTVGPRLHAGCQPYGGVMLGSDGAIYGTTMIGGLRTANYGTVYRLEH